jgi:hypothetical protein
LHTAHFLNAALAHEQIALELFGVELMTERLTAKRLGPHGVSIIGIMLS